MLTEDDVRDMGFTVREAKHNKTCIGCMFRKLPVSICHAACAVAVSRGIPDCDQKNEHGKRHIYVVADLRQIDIEEIISQRAADHT